MRLLLALVMLGVCSCLNAQDIVPGESEIVEASVSIPTRFLNNPEKRCDMVNELAEKSGMNYRLLAMKLMEKWQASIKKDKTFFKETMRHDLVEFSVKKGGAIEIQGKDSEIRQKKESERGNKMDSESRNKKAVNAHDVKRARTR